MNKEESGLTSDLTEEELGTLRGIEQNWFNSTLGLPGGKRSIRQKFRELIRGGFDKFDERRLYIIAGVAVGVAAVLAAEKIRKKALLQTNSQKEKPPSRDLPRREPE